MELVYRMLNKNYLQLTRHAFQTHPSGHRMFQDLDDLINQKENFIEYIKYEYSTAVFYNLVVSIPAFIYFFSRLSGIFECDWVSSLWILFVSLVKILDIIPKIVLIYQTIRISNNSNDPIICSRRLMYMTRSNIFFYNTILGYCLLLAYTFYFICIRRTTTCERAPQFYYIINWLIFGFFIRLIISFINYFLHFKYGINEADLQNANLYTDYSNRISPDVMKMIDNVLLTSDNIDKYVGLNEDNEREVCCICMLPFEIEENIKLLPCNNKHIFHKNCIEKWLSNNKNCPTCRKEINKKLIQKNKIY